MFSCQHVLPIQPHENCPISEFPEHSGLYIYIKVDLRGRPPQTPLHCTEQRGGAAAQPPSSLSQGGSMKGTVVLPQKGPHMAPMQQPREQSASKTREHTRADRHSNNTTTPFLLDLDSVEFKLNFSYQITDSGS
jgi:hypothetical protein